jgi:hypothetical protein
VVQARGRAFGTLRHRWVGWFPPCRAFIMATTRTAMAVPIYKPWTTTKAPRGASPPWLMLAIRKIRMQRISKRCVGSRRSGSPLPPRGLALQPLPGGHGEGSGGVGAHGHCLDRRAGVPRVAPSPTSIGDHRRNPGSQCRAFRP